MRECYTPDEVLLSDMRKSIMLVLIVHLLLYAAIGLNVPIFRQIIVFIYLSFVPGFILLGILKLREISIVEKILFSIGLSIALVMGIGFLTSQLYIVGLAQPLSPILLTVVISLFSFVFFIIGHKQAFSEISNGWKDYSNEIVKFIPKSTIFILPPILGVVSALFTNIPLLMCLLIMMAILIVLTMFCSRIFPPKFYPLMIFSFALALLFHVIFTSKYVIGFDANIEFYVFQLTQTNGHWSLLDLATFQVITAKYNAMFSITILPTVYSAMMNINGTLLIKILYPFVFSLVPVALYQIYAKQVGSANSFASAVFLISGWLVFYGFEPISVNRQIVAIFFLVLSIFILLNQSISVTKRRFLLIAFGAVIVVSHYSVMYLYLALLLFLFVYSKIRARSFSDHVLSDVVVLSLFTLSFSWYIYTAAPFNDLGNMLTQFFSSFLSDLFNASARTTQLSITNTLSNVSSIFSLGLFVIVHLIIAVGLIDLIFRPNKYRIDSRYRMLSIFFAIILLLCLTLPNFAPALNLSRFYGISLLFLAPFLVLGLNFLVKIGSTILLKITRKKSLEKRYSMMTVMLLCLILVSFFFTQTGFVNRVSGSSPLARPIDLDRIKISNSFQVETAIYQAYISEQDAYSAVWLSKHMDSQTIIYADYVSTYNVLTSSGLISKQLISPIENMPWLGHRYVYLGQHNIVLGLIVTSQTIFSNASEILSNLYEEHIIYSNSESEIRYVIKTMDK